MSEMERTIPQWCGGCKEARTIECCREGCPTAARLSEEAHYAQINLSLLAALEDIVNAQGDTFEEAAAIERAEMLLNKVRSNG